DAWVVRVASGSPLAATTLLEDSIGGATQLTVAAASEGAWGNHLRLRVDSIGGGRFNLTISEGDVATRAGQRQEGFLGPAVPEGGGSGGSGAPSSPPPRRPHGWAQPRRSPAAPPRPTSRCRSSRCLRPTASCR